MKLPQRKCYSLFLAALCLFASGTVPPLRAQTLTPQQQRAYDIYKELVEINTVTPTGDTGVAADAMAARLKAAGFSDSDVRVFKSAPRKGNSWRGCAGRGAQTDSAHGAPRRGGSAAGGLVGRSLQAARKDGYFYGRGSGDDKFMAATFVSNLIRYKQEGYKPDRDIILLLETDEEILDRNAVGVQWMIKNHRDLIDAEFALNEGGAVGMRNGKVLRNNIQTSEKVPVDFSFKVTNSGGHSSVPSKNNAIYHLAGGLSALAQYDFPLKLNDTTSTWLEEAPGFAEDKQMAAT